MKQSPLLQSPLNLPVKWRNVLRHLTVTRDVNTAVAAVSTHDWHLMPIHNDHPFASRDFLKPNFNRIKFRIHPPHSHPRQIEVMDTIPPPRRPPPWNHRLGNELAVWDYFSQGWFKQGAKTSFGCKIRFVFFPDSIAAHRSPHWALTKALLRPY